MVPVLENVYPFEDWSTIELTASPSEAEPEFNDELIFGLISSLTAEDCGSETVEFPTTMVFPLKALGTVSVRRNNAQKSFCTELPRDV